MIKNYMVCNVYQKTCAGTPEEKRVDKQAFEGGVKQIPNKADKWELTLAEDISYNKDQFRNLIVHDGTASGEASEETLNHRNCEIGTTIEADFTNNGTPIGEVLVLQTVHR